MIYPMAFIPPSICPNSTFFTSSLVHSVQIYLEYFSMQKANNHHQLHTYLHKIGCNLKKATSPDEKKNPSSPTFFKVGELGLKLLFNPSSTRLKTFQHSILKLAFNNLGFLSKKTFICIITKILLNMELKILRRLYLEIGLQGTPSCFATTLTTS